MGESIGVDICQLCFLMNYRWFYNELDGFVFCAIEDSSIWFSNLLFVVFYYYCFGVIIEHDKQTVHQLSQSK